MTKRTQQPIEVVIHGSPSPEALARGARVLIAMTERRYGDEIRARLAREAAEREKGAA